MPNVTKNQIKALEANVAHLRAEMADPYTVSLGTAAVKCVGETLEAAETELARVKSTARISTSDLFAATHSALCAHEYVRARALLDELSQRNDNRDLLLSARAYRVPEEIVTLIQDRIDLVNSKAT